MKHIVTYRPAARQQPQNKTMATSRQQLRKYETVLGPLLRSGPYAIMKYCWKQCFPNSEVHVYTLTFACEMYTLTTKIQRTDKSLCLCQSYLFHLSLACFISSFSSSIFKEFSTCSRSSTARFSFLSIRASLLADKST